MSILELAQLVARVTGFEGQIKTDTSKPDGIMRKLMDVSRLTNMGWTPTIGRGQGGEETNRWCLKDANTARFSTYLRKSSRVSGPDVVLGLFEIAGEHIHRFPSACTHDGGCIKSSFQQVLSSTNPH